MGRPDGGAAFPTNEIVDAYRNERYVKELVQLGGMSLRDYFAAAALPGVITARVTILNADLGTDLNQESIAEEAFELADAMLAERKKAGQS
jgi:hypothetical protein